MATAATGILERTFLHFPGIGHKTERRLWENGVRSWGEFTAALRSGVTTGALKRKGNQVQLDLPTGSHRAQLRPTALKWLNAAQESQRAFRGREHEFFLSRLPSSAHWRVLAPLLADACYLDIETTGLSRHHNQVTVIGALFRGEFHQWVWPEAIDGLARLLTEAPVVVTFNGRRFDMPFLEAHFPELPRPNAHVDLMYLTKGCGVTGGQKATELHFDLERAERIREVDGAEAVFLWCKAVYGDKESYQRLLAYNRADVEMMPRLAARLCRELGTRTSGKVRLPRNTGSCRRKGHIPLSFIAMRSARIERRAHLDGLLAKLSDDAPPTVVGIDLRGNPKNPTGWVCCRGANLDTAILYDDDEIVRRTLEVEPALISIDAPLALPRGRQSVSDDSPCREAGGIVRDAERVLWSRGIGVYPALIRHMQGLTARGIDLAGRFRREGLEVIESYPGAAQDVLGIPRKKADLSLLRQGLEQFGFHLSGSETHDELDAVTSALVGYFYAADEYEGVGADDECYLIIPRWTGTREWATHDTVHSARG